ncbi:MAG: PUA domain-containing protein [Promethearchaeota archaeon]
MPISRHLSELDINKPKKRVLEKISTILEFQFGNTVFREWIQDDTKISIKFSKKTGKIKNVFFKEERILTYKPTSGQFTLSLKGAEILKNSKPPSFRVKVMNDVQDFIKEGKSVFIKHVLEIDEKLRLDNEVLVVNESDRLIAVGKLSTPVNFFRSNHNKPKGVAVAVRKGINK